MQYRLISNSSHKRHLSTASARESSASGLTKRSEQDEGPFQGPN